MKSIGWQKILMPVAVVALIPVAESMLTLSFWGSEFVSDTKEFKRFPCMSI